LHLVEAGGTRVMGEVFAYQHTTSWLVIGDASTEFARWACRFPTLLGSPIQDFRLHYCPSAYYFLTDRGTPAESRALLASFEGAPSIAFGPGDDVLLGEGWSGPEADGDHFSRWAVGAQAFIALPAERGGVVPITIDVIPPGPQTVTVNINDAPAGKLVLGP